MRLERRVAADSLRELSRDELRRQVARSEADHRAGARDLYEMVARSVPAGDGRVPGPGGRPANALHRRELLQIGGAALIGSTLLAACSGHSSPATPTSTTPGATTTTFATSSVDAGVLRLASSIEHYAVSFYGLVAASGVVKTQALVDTAKYFSDQHADHAGFFETATTRHGGQPFNSANPAVAEMFRPRLVALSSAGATEADFVSLAYDVEGVAASTYFATVGTFEDLKLNSAIMSVGSVEARHVAIFGMILSGIAPAALPTVPARQDAPPAPASGLQTAAGAVAPGTGV
jgi:rubrerythrin